MATQVSVVFHEWHVSFHQLMSVVEEVQANTLRYPQLAKSIREKTTALLEATNRLSNEQFSESELKKIAVNALAAAEALRSVLEVCSPPKDEPLWELYDQYSDSAEVVGLSADREITSGTNTAESEPGTTLNDFIKSL